MTVVDWVFVVGLLASVVLGIWRGLVYEVLSVLNWLLALVLAQWLGDDLGRWLPLSADSPTLHHVAGFVLVFVLSVFMGGLVVWAVPKLLERVGLRPVDRALGGLFGLLRAIILMLAFTVLLMMTPLRSQPWWRDSWVAGSSLWALQQLKPLLPQAVAKYVP
jgi:membrane protein required for colicin V production